MSRNASIIGDGKRNHNLMWVGEKALANSQSLDRDTGKAHGRQAMSPHQPGHIAIDLSRVLAINYEKSLRYYCEAAGFDPPSYAFRKMSGGNEGQYHIEVTFGKPDASTFTRPIDPRESGREEVSRSAWKYLIKCGKISDDGSFQSDRRNPAAAASPANLGGSQVDGYQRSNTTRRRNVEQPQIPSDATKIAAKNGADVFRNSSINPTRLHMIRHNCPRDEPEERPLYPEGLGPLQSGSNEVPLGQKRLRHRTSNPTLLTQPTSNRTDQSHEPQRPVTSSSQPDRFYVPPQKRKRDLLEVDALNQRQLSQHDQPPIDAQPCPDARKSVAGLLRLLELESGPLFRVEVICKYIAIQPPQYLEIAGENDRRLWYARIPGSYLNANEVTLGPTAPTFNEHFGKTICAQSLVEPYLMAAIKLHGIGGVQDAHVDDHSERAVKREKLESEEMADRTDGERVQGDVEHFLQKMEVVMKSESME